MRHLTTLTVLLALLTAAAPTRAAPDADLWERWLAHDPASTAVIDHRAWTDFLQAYVVADRGGIHRVRYGAVTPTDRAALDAYIAQLGATPVSTLNRDEQRAFWINLYNALTVQVVLDHYPVASIRDIDISPGMFADGPWGAELANVEGQGLSLDDIEHRILRPIWRDPRIHYAVNCASIGCPNLMTQAFTAANADALMTEAAHDFINDPRGVHVRGDELLVSSIYDWFEEDFGGSEAGVLAHLRIYAAPALASQLQAFDDIDDDKYDWTLNDVQ